MVEFFEYERQAENRASHGASRSESDQSLFIPNKRYCVAKQTGQTYQAIKGHSRLLKGANKQKNLCRQTAISEPSRQTCVRTARSNFFARCS